MRPAFSNSWQRKPWNGCPGTARRSRRLALVLRADQAAQHVEVLPADLAPGGGVARASSSRQAASWLFAGPAMPSAGSETPAAQVAGTPRRERGAWRARGGFEPIALLAIDVRRRAALNGEPLPPPRLESTS
jgi:hypothetical protein